MRHRVWGCTRAPAQFQRKLRAARWRTGASSVCALGVGVRSTRARGAAHLRLRAPLVTSLGDAAPAADGAGAAAAARRAAPNFGFVGALDWKVRCWLRHGPSGARALERGLGCVASRGFSANGAREGVAPRTPSSETCHSAEAVSSLFKARAAAHALLGPYPLRAQPVLRPQCALRPPAESVRSLNPNPPASSTFGAVAAPLARRIACNAHGRCALLFDAGLRCACLLACCTNTLLAAASRHALRSSRRAAAAICCKWRRLRAPDIPCRRLARCGRALRARRSSSGPERR